MKFEFYYKDQRIEVYINNPTLEESRSFDNIRVARIVFTGNKSQIDNQVHNILDGYLRENQKRRVDKNIRELCIRLEQEYPATVFDAKYGLTVFRSRKVYDLAKETELALYLLIAVRRFVEDHKTDIQVLEKPDYIESGDRGALSISELIDRNELDNYIKDKLESISPVNVQLYQLYNHYSYQAKQPLLKIAESIALLISQCGAESPLKSVLVELNKQIDDIVRDKTSATTLVRNAIATAVFAAYQEIFAVAQTDADSYELVNESQEQLKKLLLKTILDQETDQQIKSSDPILICYEIADICLLHQQKSDSALLGYKLKKQAERWRVERWAAELLRHIENETDESLEYLLLPTPTSIQIVKETFTKFEEAAVRGHPNFQALVGELYSNETPFNLKSIPKACKFLRAAALSGNARALRKLVEIDAVEGNATSKYYLGQIYLARLETDKAINYFSQIPADSKHYQNALFEISHIKFCLEKDKNLTLTHVIGEETLLKTTEVSENKAVNLMDVQKILEECSKTEVTFFSHCNSEIKEVAEHLVKPYLNDRGRYNILREYVLDERNQGSRLYNIIINKFGAGFFTAESQAVAKNSLNM